MKQQCDKYFIMIDALLGMELSYEVRDVRGQLLVANGPALVAHKPHPDITPRSPTEHARVTERLLDNQRRVFSADIYTKAGVVCYCINLFVESDQRVDATAVAQALLKVVPLMESEFQLHSELDSMAEELIGRYEELNLVYERVDVFGGYENEGEALNQLISHCAEHLNVDLVALSIPRQEKVYCAVGIAADISDPYLEIDSLQVSLSNHFATSEDGIIINSLTDPQRSRLRIEAPYKVLACPVFGNGTKLHGVMICLRGIDKPDFYNSDRNLLQVVVTKISKLVQSHYDPLTSLINRKALESQVGSAIAGAKREGIFHCFLLVDMAQLQVTNETYGRAVGDWLIKGTGRVLKSKLRVNDTIGYLGEGKFGIVLSLCDTKTGGAVAEKLHQAISTAPFEWNEDKMEASVHIGLALIQPHTKNVADVLEAAEIASSTAKDHGRSGVRIYSHDDEELAVRKEKMQWVNRIQHALRDDRFELYAQEIRPVKANDERYHFEVLLRMLDDEGKAISPGAFMPAAEQFNMMPTIDRWVLDRAFQQFSDNGLGNTNHEGVMSINLSGQSLSNLDLTDYIRDKLAFYKIDPTCLCFEITETAAIDSIASAHSILRALKHIGCYISLDDFGTGLSSFTYLQTLPIDYVKIDGSFVKRLLDDNVSHAMVTSINHIGHVMNLKTVAEFVENDELQAEVKAIGIDYMQGYGIAKPIALQNYLNQIKLQDHLRASKSNERGR